MMSKGVIPEYDRVTTGAGKATPYVSDDEWYYVRSQLPPKAPDDLYVMKYSNRDDVVKIGRSRDVEARRRALESGHAFYVTVVAVFPQYGYLEMPVHQRLDMFRSKGAGREWFNVTSKQAIQTIQWFTGETHLAAQAVLDSDQQTEPSLRSHFL